MIARKIKPLLYFLVLILLLIPALFFETTPTFATFAFFDAANKFATSANVNPTSSSGEWEWKLPFTCSGSSQNGYNVSPCGQGYFASSGPSDPTGGAAYALINTTKNKSMDGYFYRTLTWEQMGVPAGAKITSVSASMNGSGFDSNIGATQCIGMYLYNGANDTNILTGASDCNSIAPIITGWDPACTTINTTCWSNKTGTASIPSAYEASNTSVTIRVAIKASTPTSGNSTYRSEGVVDNINLTITTTPLCAPAVSSISTGQNVTFSVAANTGTPSYNWSVSPTSGVSPTTGTGTTYGPVTFNNTGTFTATVTDSAGKTGLCSVTVTSGGVASPAHVRVRIAGTNTSSGVTWDTSTTCVDSVSNVCFYGYDSSVSPACSKTNWFNMDGGGENPISVMVNASNCPTGNFRYYRYFVHIEGSTGAAGLPRIDEVQLNYAP